MFFSCLLVSCDAGEKKTDEPVRIKVAEVEISRPSAAVSYTHLDVYKRQLSGSFIISGNCHARVEHVGKDNYAAQITDNAKYVKKPNSEIMRWTNRIIKYIGFTLIPVGIALFCKQVFISHQGFNDAIVGVVAALIGMIPEGLILLTSVVFAVSIIRLSQHKTLVQELYLSLIHI